MPAQTSQSPMDDMRSALLELVRGRDERGQGGPPTGRRRRAEGFSAPRGAPDPGAAHRVDGLRPAGYFPSAREYRLLRFVRGKAAVPSTRGRTVRVVPAP